MLNDLIRTYKKIILAVVLILCAILVWFFGCHRFAGNKDGETEWKQTAKDELIYEFTTPQTSGSIIFGTCGHLTADRIQPVVMYIAGREAEFTGTVRITLPGEDGKGISYQAAVKCPRGSDQRVMLSVPRLGNVSFFSVELLDQYGTEELARMIVGTSAKKLSSDSGEASEKKDVGIGILSDEPEKLKWIDGLEISTSADRCYVFEVVAINEKNLLEGADFLESLSGIIIDDFDSSRLSYRQKQSLKEWVETKGGTLIAGTGAHAGKVLAGMENILGARLGEEKTQSLQFYDGDESAGYLSVHTNDIILSDRSLWNASGVSFPVSCYQRYLGKGRMMLLTWSFTEDVFSQWIGREKMTQALLDAVVAKISHPDHADEVSIWYLKNSLYSWLASRVPNTFYYALFFIVYLAALFFFCYYFLRRTKKREYIWFIVPALSLFFTICLAVRAGGFANSGTNSYSAIEIEDSADSVNDVFLLYQNNEGEGNHASLVGNVSSVEPMDYSYLNEENDVASIARLRPDYTINNTQNGYEIEFEETIPGTSRLLQIKKKKVGESDQCFDTELTASHTFFYGKIVNQSGWDYSRILLIRGNQYTILDDVKAGEEREIQAGDITCWSLYDHDNSSINTEGHVGPGGLVEYIRYRYTEDNNDLNTVIIAGITDDREIDLFQDQDSIRNRQTVLVNRVSLNQASGLHYISNINRRCLAKDYADSLLARDTLEDRKTKAVYQFDRDKIVWYGARNRDRYNGRIYAYNYQTGKEDLIFEHPDDVINGEGLEPYLSEMNKMILTYEKKDDEDIGPAPLLTFILKDVTKEP